MIRLNCAHCNAQLTIDDAFAGGACRCQFCGTIQTVPKNAALTGSVSGAGQRTLYQNLRATNESAAAAAGATAETEGGGEGELDHLADIVASSGLAGSGLAGIPSHKPAATAPRPAAGGIPQNFLVLIAVGGVVIIGLLALVLYLMFSGGSPTPGPTNPGQNPTTWNPGNTQTPPPNNTTVTPNPTPPTASGPHFCGVPLDGPSVVYVLDRGDGTRAVFGYLQNATTKSIATLGPTRKFQVVFWKNGGGAETAYPAKGLAAATPKEIEAATKMVEDVFAMGRSDAKGALDKAFAANPAAIVLATGKGADLDDAFVQMVLKARKTSAAKVHTFSLGATPSPALKQLAEKTGGQYREPGAQELQHFGE